jgi:hypothetical protein
VANALNRFAVSSWMPFKYDPDGSLDPQASPHFLRDIKESISRMAIPEGIVEPA